MCPQRPPTVRGPLPRSLVHCLGRASDKTGVWLRADGPGTSTHSTPQAHACAHHMLTRGHTNHTHSHTQKLHKHTHVHMRNTPHAVHTRTQSHTHMPSRTHAHITFCLRCPWPLGCSQARGLGDSGSHSGLDRGARCSATRAPGRSGRRCPGATQPHAVLPQSGWVANGLGGPGGPAPEGCLDVMLRLWPAPWAPWPGAWPHHRQAGCPSPLLAQHLPPWSLRNCEPQPHTSHLGGRRDRGSGAPVPTRDHSYPLSNTARPAQCVCSVKLVSPPLLR